MVATYGSHAQRLIHCLPDKAFKDLVLPLIEHGAASGQQDDVLPLLPALGGSGGVGYRGDRGRTLLQAAAKGGCHQVIRELLLTEAKKELNLSFTTEEKNPMRNLSFSDSCSPLYYAVLHCRECGDDRAAFALIDAGADCKFSHEGLFEDQMIELAVEARNIHLVRMLLVGGAHVDVDAEIDDDWECRTPLQTACSEGIGPEMVRLLLDRGAGVKNTGPDGTALSLAVDEYLKSRDKSSLDTIDLLLQHGGDRRDRLICALPDLALLEKLIQGVDLNVMEEHWIDLPLHEAARYHTPATLRLLIENGADANLKAGDGFTPLLSAVRHGRHENARALLRLGAKVDDGRLGLTPLMVCASGKMRKPKVKVSDVSGCIGVLVEFGANVEALSPEGKTIGQLIDERSGSGKGRAKIRAALDAAVRDRTWSRRRWVLLARARILAQTNLEKVEPLWLLPETVFQCVVKFL